MHVPLERLLQTGPAIEVVRRQDLANAAVETLHHAVGLRRFRPGQPMLDAQLFAELVELVVTGGALGSRPEQPVRELLAVVGEQGPYSDRAGLVQLAQEAPGRRGALVGADIYKDLGKR